MKKVKCNLDHRTIFWVYQIVNQEEYVNTGHAIDWCCPKCHEDLSGYDQELEYED